MSKDNETPMNHDYDGIQEYDNPLPMWWLITFLAAIIFSYLYYLHYTTGVGLTLSQEFDRDMAEVRATQAEHDKKAAPPSDADAAVLAADSSAKEKGRTVYEAKCAVCHGPKLEGNIGPNLTDDFWINGQGQLKDIVGLVQNGVTDKGMPAWKDLLKVDEVNAVSAYVVSAKGSNPPNAKAPQGNKVAK